MDRNHVCLRDLSAYLAGLEPQISGINNRPPPFFVGNTPNCRHRRLLVARLGLALDDKAAIFLTMAPLALRRLDRDPFLAERVFSNKQKLCK